MNGDGLAAGLIGGCRGPADEVSAVAQQAGKSQTVPAGNINLSPIVSEWADRGHEPDFACRVDTLKEAFLLIAYAWGDR
jgi:hypothetical protein